MIDIVESRDTTDWGLQDRLLARIVRGEDVGEQVEAGSVDIAVTNLGFQFFQDQLAGARGMWSVLKEEGVAWVTLWKQIGFLSSTWKARLPLM
jgi:hypothetical protein